MKRAALLPAVLMLPLAALLLLQCEKKNPPSLQERVQTFRELLKSFFGAGQREQLPSVPDAGQAETVPPAELAHAPIEEAVSTLVLPSFVNLYKMAAPAVVDISVKEFAARGPQERRFPFSIPPPLAELLESKVEEASTGFLISPDGQVLTTYSPMKGNVEVRLQNGKLYPARVIGEDPLTDVSVLQIDAGGPLPVLRLGDSDALSIGDWVLAVGNPFGLSHTVTAGIVSAKGRKEFFSEKRKGYENYIQVDASINPGNAGTPLLSLSGEVVGICIVKPRIGQGISFAIPINMVKDIIADLLRDGKVTRSWLGVVVGPVGEEYAEGVGLAAPQGALVSEVEKDGPAEGAGIRKGDIILKFDGKEVATFQDLPWLASRAGVGRQVDVAVWRGGMEVLIQVTMGEMPERGE